MKFSQSDLVQIRPSWDAHGNGKDVNIWSRVHPRFAEHDGCIVDLGCLGWNKDFYDKTSDNWAGFFFGKKRVIGVDPQETSNPNAELFKGFISSFSGKANLSKNGIAGQMLKSFDGEHDVLTWSDFKEKFNIGPISILKINIEGAEWDLIKSLNASDFKDIDQIAISFHNFLPEFANNYVLTNQCVDKLLSFNFTAIDLEIYGWKLFIKN
jgi:hypothetical protein